MGAAFAGTLILLGTSMSEPRNQSPGLLGLLWMVIKESLILLNMGTSFSVSR